MFLLWLVWRGSNHWRCIFLGQALVGSILFATQLGIEQRMATLGLCYAVQASVMLTPPVKAWTARMAISSRRFN